MTDYTAQIKAKGLDATGVTEDIARQLYSRLGSHMMFIVEARVDGRIENNDGVHKVQLYLTQVEPCTDSTLEDHLRELTKTLAYNRKLTQDDVDGQPTLDGGDDIEPKVADVLAAGRRFEPHPYLSSQLAVDDTEQGPVCDVCGLVEAERVHHMPAVNPFGVDRDDEDQDPDDGYDDDPDEDEDDDEDGAA